MKLIAGHVKGLTCYAGTAWKRIDREQIQAYGVGPFAPYCGAEDARIESNWLQ